MAKLLITTLENETISDDTKHYLSSGLWLPLNKENTHKVKEGYLYRIDGVLLKCSKISIDEFGKSCFFHSYTIL